ncbi:MAG: PTS sugar transporter subunit IIA [Deltaproteobacteria bacterium]|nr:PTS sugar transporter subunit IIA [Deltaproteobacteria bacterium]
MTDYLTSGQICLNFMAGSKVEVLEALSGLAAKARGLPQADILEVLTAREELGSTGIGEGVALPHGRLPNLASPLLCLALSPGGVEFDSLDGQPVRLLALVLTGAEGREHLQLLARLGALLKSPEAVAEILAARTPFEVLNLLARY